MYLVSDTKAEFRFPKRKNQLAEGTAGVLIRLITSVPQRTAWRTLKATSWIVELNL